jgi:Carboxypeptidase regulatory-like domain
VIRLGAMPTANRGMGGFGRVLLLAAAIATASQSSVAAQVGVQTVRGRVMERGQTRAVANAVIRLGESAQTTTDTTGRFEIRSVRPGRYDFVVEAFGYRAVQTVVTVDGTEDITATIELDPAPIGLEPLDVRLGRATLRGRIVGADGGRPVPYATVRLGEGTLVAARDYGAFSVGSLSKGRHTLTIESFGWLPAQIALDLAHDTTVEVTLQADPITVRMIETQVKRLSDRSRSLGYALRTLDRRDITGSKAPTTIQYLKGRGVPILECPLTPSRLCLSGRPPIVFIDEIQVCGLEVLDIYPMATLQRIEIIGRDRSTIRAYTIWYIERLTRRDVTLQPFTGWERPLPCASG